MLRYRVFEALRGSPTIIIVVRGFPAKNEEWLRYSIECNFTFFAVVLSIYVGYIPCSLLYG